MHRPGCEVSADLLHLYAADWWALAMMRQRRGEPFASPVAAFLPTTVEEVAECVSWATASGYGVIARGGGSGVCGAVVPGEGTVVLDMTKMDQIDIDPSSMVVRTGAGTYGPALEDALNAKGLTLGHVPQSFHLSTVGGWVATKATGQLSTRYGGIEDRLLGMTAVLADGDVVSNRPVPRSSAGPDWWRMFLGAEGTLGVVTEVVLSAFPVPPQSKWLEVKFGSFNAGLAFARELIVAGVRPAVARVYDTPDASVNFGALGVASPLGVFRFEGIEELVSAEHDVALRLASDHEVVQIGAGDHWWEHRFKAADTYRQILSGEGAIGPLGVADTMEVAAFWPDLPGLYEEVVAAMGDQVDVLMAHASHLYMSGANIYFTFLIASAKDEHDAEQRYHDAWRAGADAVERRGATVSHHHGIGLQKAPWLTAEWGTGRKVNEAIKKALDPDGRMNPGKLF